MKNKMHNLFIDRVPPDVLIACCLFMGSLVRLGRGEKLTPRKSLNELVFGIVIGASFTGFVVAVADWKLASGWWVAIASAFFASMIVGIIEKKADQLSSMSIGASVKLVIREVLSEIKKFKMPGEESGTNP